MSPRNDTRVTTAPLPGSKAAEAIAKGAPVERKYARSEDAVPFEMDDIKTNPHASDFETLQARARAAAVDSRKTLALVEKMLDERIENARWWRRMIGAVVTSVLSGGAIATAIIAAIAKGCG